VRRASRRRTCPSPGPLTAIRFTPGSAGASGVLDIHGRTPRTGAHLPAARDAGVRRECSPPSVRGGSSSSLECRCGACARHPSQRCPIGHIASEARPVGEGRLLSRLAFRVGLSRLLRWPIFNSTLAIVIARAGARPRTSRLVYGLLSRRGPLPAHRPQTVRSSSDNDFQSPTEPTV
jgi:hypothetical protein